LASPASSSSSPSGGGNNERTEYVEVSAHASLLDVVAVVVDAHALRRFDEATVHLDENGTPVDKRGNQSFPAVLMVGN